MFWIQDDRLKIRCMELLIAQSRSAFIATATGCLLLLITFYSKTGFLPFMIWGSLYIISGVARVFTGLAFMSAGKDRQQKNLWFAVYGFCIFLSGLCWGIFLLFLSLNATNIQLIILLVTYTALIAGAVTAYSVSLPIFLLFSIPLIVPVLLKILLNFDGDNLLLVAVVFCWYIFMVTTARKFSQFAMRSLGYEYRNSKLVLELEEQNRRAEVLAEELMVLSNTDSLTDLYNRRYFDERIKDEWSRALRGGHPLSVILCDIDFFKAYNDTLGHPAGDVCLERVADVFRRMVREGTDFAVRYGGEEFAIVLSGTKSYRAKILAERLRTALHDLNIPHPKSAASDRITLSMGIATLFPSKNAKVGLLVQLADKALYIAKNSGRNRIEVSDYAHENQVLKRP